MLELFKDYDCIIDYHPEKANVVANALSRKMIFALTLKDYDWRLALDGALLAQLRVLSDLKQMIVNAQKDDAKLQEIVQLVNTGDKCDAPFPGGPLTTRQAAEYSWMSGNLTPLMKIGQSLLCTGSSTQGTTCANHMATCLNILQRPHWVHVLIKMSKMATWAHALILTKLHQLFTNSSRVITILLTKTYIKI